MHMSRKISRYQPELNTITKYVRAEIFNSRWPKFCFDGISKVVESYRPCVPSVKTDLGGYETTQVASP